MFPGRVSALIKMVTPQRYLSRTFMARNARVIYGGELRNRPDLAIEFSHSTRAPGKVAYLQQLAATTQFLGWLWLHRVRCPALVLNGDDDPLIRAINARLLAALLPNAKLELIKGGWASIHAIQRRKNSGTDQRFHRRLGSRSRQSAPIRGSEAGLVLKLPPKRTGRYKPAASICRDIPPSPVAGIGTN